MTPSQDPTRRHLLIRMAVVAGIGLAGCTSLLPRDVTVSEAQLQAILDRQFPREQRWLDVFEIRVTHPTLRLMPERNRIATSMDVVVSERLEGRAFHGGLSLDHALRYEPNDGTLRLTKVRVQELRLDAGGSPLQGQGARIGSILAEKLLDDLVIHRLDAAQRERLRQAGLGAGEITVSARGITLHLLDTPR
jgi:hypothetical protein